MSVGSLRQFANSLARLPLVLGHEIAKDQAPALSSLARESFESSATPYGVPWAPGVDGRKITLRKSGALERGVRYVAIGAKLRVALPTRYAKFQIGKRPVLPAQGADLPASYRASLAAAARRIATRILVEGST